jgi:hypothetical protein
MTGATLPFDDWLALAGEPADAGLYFVGTFDRRITFYSQQVRALRLVHALNHLGRLKPTDRVGVVGAGAAGVTAALALALLNIDVTLYDPADSVLQLQSASPRLLHPHIYEWPGLGSLDDRAGLPFLDWSAGNGGAVCAQLQLDFKAAKTRLQNFRFKNAHTLTSVTKAGAQWLVGLTVNGKPPSSRQFDHVVLAMGFGDEMPCGVAIPNHYWKQNSTATVAAEPQSPATYVVSGNGDGGLTDLLSLLIQNFEHVGFTRRFLNYFPDDVLRSTTDAACAGLAAGDDLETAFATHLLPLLIERGVLDRLSELLRTDRRVTINSGGSLFAAEKAAQLNQIMAFAVLETAKEAGRPVRRSAGYVTNVTASASGFQLTSSSAAGAPLSDTFQHVVLRHGPDSAARYQAARPHFDAYKAHVTGLLVARPELNAPPSLDPATYDFFEALRIDKLEDHASQAASNASAASAKAMLVLGIDPAAHVPIEQGNRRLREVADECERLANNVVVHFAAGPAAFPADDIVRLARASGGRIILAAGPAGLADWQAIVPVITPAPPAVSHYLATALDLAGLSEAIDACLLRLLDERVKSALASRQCETLGPVSASIACAIEPTWAQWHATLDADHTLRADFLRWLANVKQDGRLPWNGDHAHIPHLATALVMMLATHHGEPLQPASADLGNLNFGYMAVALGSGCQMVSQQPIAIWDQPDQWGVDALILSGSAEVEVMDPPGRVLDGGKAGTGMAAAKRVRPVVIRNDKQWRSRLAGDLADWRTVVQAEFSALRDRQDKELEEVSK